LVRIALLVSVGGCFSAVPSALAIDRHWDDDDGNWISSGNWDPNGVPDTGDDVFIGTYFVANDALVIFGIVPPFIDTVANLTIVNGADLDVNGGRIVVSEETNLGGDIDGSTDSELLLSPVEDLPGVDALLTHKLSILSRGQLTMSGASISVTGADNFGDGLGIAIGGEIFGYGTIDLGDVDPMGVLTLLKNLGTITVGTPNEFIIGEPSARTLSINSRSAGARIDLHGDVGNNGRVIISRNTTLDLNVDDAANGLAGVMQLFGNATLDLAFPSRLANGTLFVNSGAVPGFITLPAVPAVVRGESFTLGTGGLIELNQSDEVLRFESGFVTSGSAADPPTIVTAGTIHFADTASITSDTSITAQGTGRLVNDFDSTMTLEDGVDADTPLTNDGVLLLGNPGALNTTIAQIQIDSYTQTATGRVVFTIGGVIPGQFDVLTVEGNAALEGRLIVSLINDFEPILGNSFPILETVFGNVSGEFDTAILPLFNGLSFDVIYNPQSVLLEVVAALPGDYNDDGIVDAADYTTWRDNLGAPPGTLPNDFEGSPIGQAQYDVWVDNFGSTLDAGSSSLADAGVPEPATFVLALILALCIMPRRLAAGCASPR
jgi:hypothetical protein